MVDRSSRREEIVASAVELLDDEGLDGLSMRRLSERTGASASSVYWYVKGREELVALTLDQIITEVELPEIEPGGWRPAAAAMARDFRAMMLRHPWLGLVTASYPNSSGVAIARHNEHLLTVYEAAGFRDGEVDLAVDTVYAFALGAAVGEVGVRAWRPAAEDEDAPLDGEALAQARAAAEGMPRLLARIDALEGADPTAISQEAFEFGLEVVLDGLEARLADAKP